MAKQVVVNPEAQLERHHSDVLVSDKQLLGVSLFAKLKQKPSLEKFPGTWIVRRYRQGEVIFRQGEAGWTAFYPLTTEDVLGLRLEYQKTVMDFDLKQEVSEELTMLTTRFAQLQVVQQGSAKENSLRRVATVHLAVARPTPKGAPGLWRRLRRMFGGGAARAKHRPQYIPIDGPRDIDYETMQAPIYEGELFGEMSCLYRTPRSGTVVAARDCYMIEVMRNILDACQRDPAYKAMTDDLYKKRVLQLHLQQLSLFRNLTPSQYAAIQNEIELVSFKAGQIVFDEHERSDSLYIIRNGLLKVVKKASALLADNQVRTWKPVFDKLREAEAAPATPIGKLYQMLPEPTRTALKGIRDTAQAGAAHRDEVRYGINQVIMNRQFGEAKEVQPLLTQPELAPKLAEFPEKRAQFTDSQSRHFNRLLVETIFGGAIRGYRKRVGPECILNYLARGEYVGEMGVLTDQPRGATCIAHGHQVGTTKDPGQVELVRIPARVFRDLVDASPGMREQLESAAAQRQEALEHLSERDVWEEHAEVQFSHDFEAMGLIQGQRLMLIDLDRCTRCDECVRACVDTHDDGYSRLFLDGPRFGKYLVPTSCRSCLDPVCMIGCPVGSIHRGDNGQIVIEDWCIGCGLCDNQCPYGSIQMHDVGVIAEKSRGWRFHYAAEIEGTNWTQLRFDERRWGLGESPFFYNQEFRNQLSRALPSKKVDVMKSSPMLYFRYTFQLDSAFLRSATQLKLELTSTDPSVTLWVNGRELTSEKPKKNSREFNIPPKEPKDSERLMPEDVFRAGRNVIAIRATPRAAPEEPLVRLRMDEVRRAEADAETSGDVMEKVVTERAVVCDLCSSQYGQVPACVNACPHDAAMRVNARFNFPTR